VTTSQQYNYKFRQIQQAFSLFSWFLAIFVQPVALCLLWMLLHFPRITPNWITTLGVLLRLSVAGLFWHGTHMSLLCGALSYYVVTVLDAVDGPLARLTGRATEFGRYFDHSTDLIGDFLVLLALGLGQKLFPEPILFGMLFMHIAECYMSYLAGFAISPDNQGQPSFALFGLVNRYRRWWFDRNLKSFFSFPDYTALVFVIFPLLGFPAAGLQVGFYFLLVIVCYTVFSTFVSLHTGERRFP
jgi:phosphatidylglycerophosphate synthase